MHLASTGVSLTASVLFIVKKRKISVITIEFQNEFSVKKSFLSAI